jgi:hypothetical protein
MFPDKPWMLQKSSPFIFCGNWMDTVFYSSAEIIEVIEPSDDMPYFQYRVQWRKKEITVLSTDYAQYKVGAKVTILKNADAKKPSQLWKDDDTDKFTEREWVIAPISFYGYAEKEK